MVGDYFKSKVEILVFANVALDLIAWLHSKTFILTLLREVQQALPGNTNIRAVIRAVLTRWTMHYQAFWRLWELNTVIIMVFEDDEKKPVKESNMITRDAKAKAKVTEMVKLIKNPAFWITLSVYVTAEIFTMICCLIIGHMLGWNVILNHLLSHVMVMDHAALGGAYTRLFRPRRHTGLTKTTKEEVDGRDHKGTMPEIE